MAEHTNRLEVFGLYKIQHHKYESQTSAAVGAVKKWAQRILFVLFFK